MTVLGQRALTATPASPELLRHAEHAHAHPVLRHRVGDVVREPLRVHVERRREVEDVRVCRLQEVREAAPASGEGAAGVHAVHQVEALHRRLQRARQADRARVVHQDVDAAERLDRLRRPPRRSAPRTRMSTWSGRALPPAASISRGGREDGAGELRVRLGRLGGDDDVRAVRAARSAIAMPMPRLAPVMKSVFPFNVPMANPPVRSSPHACRIIQWIKRRGIGTGRFLEAGRIAMERRALGRGRAHGVGDGARLHGDVGVLRSRRRGGVGRHDPPRARPRDRPPRHERHLRSRAQRDPGRQGDPGSPGAGRPRDEVRAAPRGGRELEGSEREARVCALRLRGVALRGSAWT